MCLFKGTRIIQLPIWLKKFFFTRLGNYKFTSLQGSIRSKNVLALERVQPGQSIVQAMCLYKNTAKSFKQDFYGIV